MSAVTFDLVGPLSETECGDFLRNPDPSWT